MEKRSSILKLDSEAMKLARIIVKTSQEDRSVIEALVKEHDQLTQAVITMRETSEMVMCTPSYSHLLRENIVTANFALTGKVESEDKIVHDDKSAY